MSSNGPSSSPQVTPDELEIYTSITAPGSAKSFQDVIEDAGFAKLATARLAKGDPCFDFKQSLYNFSDGKFGRTGETFHLLEDCVKQPVALVFGSYTCGVFRREWPPMHDLWKRYGNQITFVTVYITEMHPVGGWETIDNREDGIMVAQPGTLPEREELAGACAKLLNIQTSFVIDPMDNSIAEAYGALPNRFYLVGTSGQIVFRGEPGPQGFKPDALEVAIKNILA